MENTTTSSMYLAEAVANLTFEAKKTDYVSAEDLLRWHFAVVGVWYSIALTGLCNNVLNMKTFYRMGPKDSVTVSFFCLAISDFIFCFASLTGIVAFTFDFTSRWRKTFYYLPPLIPDFFLYFLRKIFTFTSMLITSFLATQRCLCVVMPFHVKGVFTRRRTIVYMVVILSFSVTCTALFTWKHKVRPKFNEAFNRTQLVIYIPQGGEPFVFLVEVFVGTAMNSFCQLLVMICLVIMVIMLRRSSQFRQSATAQVPRTRTTTTTTTTLSKGKNTIAETSQAKGATQAKAGTPALQSKERTKEAQALIQVSLVSTIFAIANSPYLASGIVHVLVPEFGIYKAYHNLYNLIHNVIFSMDIINIINFLVYYNYNTKFRKYCPIGRRKDTLTYDQ